MTYDLFSQPPNFDTATFAGSDYVPKFDNERLRGQIKKVYELMKDGKWRTLDEIATKIREPHASVSAQLRHLRNKHGMTIEKQVRGERENGLWEYQMMDKIR